MSSSHPLNPISASARPDPGPPTPGDPGQAPPNDAAPVPGLLLVVRTFEAAQERRIRLESQLRPHMRRARDAGTGAEPPNGSADAAGAPSPAGALTDALTDALTSARMVAALRRTRRHAHERPSDAPAAGPLAALMAATYLEYVDEELALRRAVVAGVRGHPAWPWLTRVRGMSATLAAGLLTRLDPARAPHASSFARYCGLATVPGLAYRCDTCGARVRRPRGAAPAGHHAPDGAACIGPLRPAGAARVAQPRWVRDEPRPYNAQAKRLVYFLALRFVRAGAAYGRYYESTLDSRLARRPAVAAAAHRVAALRAVQQLFLYHLWVCWREQVGLPVAAPFAEACLHLPPVPRYTAMAELPAPAERPRAVEAPLATAGLTTAGLTTAGLGAATSAPGGADLTRHAGWDE